jgi:hypothetical protein
MEIRAGRGFVTVVLGAWVMATLAGCGGDASARGRRVPAAPVIATFSCLLGGRPFAGGGTDGLVNVAFRRPDHVVEFVLMPIDAEAGPVGQRLRLELAVADSGTTTIRGAGGDSEYSASIVGGADDDYRNDRMAITIIAQSASRLSGTFSGRFIRLKSHRVVAVAEGTFDIPFSSRPGTGGPS